MPISYAPDIRIRELDKLLLKRHHFPEGNNNPAYVGLWTKSELARTISEILDLKKTISEKTIENDLKKMEEDYNAPLDKKYIQVKVYNEDGTEKTINKIAYFYYEDKGIFNNNNLEPADLKNLRTVISILEQFKGFKHFEDISGLIEKLEVKTIKNKRPDIFFETVDQYTGMDNIDIIARAVKEKFSLKINYKPFNFEKPAQLTIHPCQLREFNNRWFVLASTEEYPERDLGVYGLERIVSKPQKTKTKYRNTDNSTAKNYFKDIIGVTNFENKRIEQVKFEIFGVRSSYVVTKPWHTSQKLIEEKENSKIFQINVKLNNELIAKILSFGSDIKIIEPKQLQKSIEEKLNLALKRYL